MSAVTAITLTTGNFGCNSFYFYSIKYPSYPYPPNSQAAPSKNKPWIKAPFSAETVTSSCPLVDVTLVYKTI